MVKLTDVKGIGPVKLKVLAEHKIKTVEALAAISLAELQKIPGFRGELRARAVKQSAADCLQGKITKPASTTSTSSNAQAVAKKTVTPFVVSAAASQSETGKVKDKSKKKAQKDDKKKVKDKEKKKKNKEKKKNAKKKDKKKS